MADKQATTLQAVGLNTSSNEFDAPQGSFQKAENCVMLAPGLIGSRKGQVAQTYATSAAPRALAYFGTVPIAHVGTTTLQHDTGSAWASFSGSYTPPDVAALRMKFMEAIQNLYFNTTLGVYRLDQATSTPRLAGVRTALDFTSGAVNSTVNEQGLAGGASWAYRLVYGTKDSHNTLFLGSPSGRLVVQNTSAADVAAFGTVTITTGPGAQEAIVNGTSVSVTYATSASATASALAVAINDDPTLGPLFLATSLFGVVTITCRTAGVAGNSTTLAVSGTGVSRSGAVFTGGTGDVSYNVALVFPVPSTLTTADFFQVYRTRQTPGGTAGAFIDPGDEEYLAFERYFTSAEIAAGTISIVDTTPDDFLGVQLYTNEISGEGILQANATPPFCKDLNFWNGVGWYGNTRQRQSITLQILGCGEGQNGFTGIRLGDTLRINSTESISFFTASGSENTSTGLFKLFTSGDAGENIENTARSLVSCINKNPLETTYSARYVSSPDGSPGQILIQTTTLEAAQFSLTLYTYGFSLPSGNLSRGGGTTVTATTTLPHGLVSGDTVYIRPTGTADANFAAGTFTATVTGATTFTYTQSGSNVVSMNAYLEFRATPVAALAWLPPPPPIAVTIPVGGLVRTTGSTVTASPTGVTGLSSRIFPGTTVTIESVAKADANFPVGTKTIVTVTSTTFTYTESGADGASTTAYQSGARVTSDPYRGIAGPSFLSYSKIGQPDAVPESNFLGVGRTDTDVLRIWPQGQNLFVFKPEGVYVVSYVGGDDPYRVDLLDSTVHLYAPDSVVSVSGRVFALTNQGVVTLTASGAQIISTPIEQELFQYFGPTLATLKPYAFGESRETDRLYRLQLPALSGASTAPYNAPLGYVYSTIAGAWTTDTLTRSCGLVRVSDDALYTGSVAGSAFYVQRNTKTAADFADGVASLTAFSWNATTRALTVASAAGVAEGDVVSVEGVGAAVVTDVDGAALTLSGAPAFPASAVGAMTISRDSGSPDFSVKINGTTVSVTWASSNTDTATALAAAVNANPTTSALVIAAGVGNRVNFTAAVAGAGSDEITIASNISGGAGTAYNRLAGGTATIHAHTAITIDPDAMGLDPGVNIDGDVFTETATTPPNAWAIALAAQINADPDASALVTAYADDGRVVLIAVAVGTGGNSVLASYYGTSTNVLDGSFGVDAYLAIPIDLKWRTFLGSSPANAKQWSELVAHFRERSFYKGRWDFSTNAVPSPSEGYALMYPGQSTVSPYAIAAYAADPDLYPGMPVAPKKSQVRSIPQDAARGAYLNVEWSIREAFAVWTLNGITLIYNDTGDREGF